MLTGSEFSERMEWIEQTVSRLSQQTDDPSAQDASELLRQFSLLHAAALRKMLALIQAAPTDSRTLLESFAQDDLVRTLLFFHDLHPIPLKTRVEDAIGNLRPLIDSYGGRVSIAEITSRTVTIRLQLDSSSPAMPTSMLKELLEHALLVAAPDAGELIFDESPWSKYDLPALPVLNSQ